MHPNDAFPSARALRIGAATVAGVIVLVVGLVIGRATAGGSSAPVTAGGTSSTSAASGLPAWATGASRMDHGVPVGYAHTRDGAVAAARNFSLALSATPLALDPQSYRAAADFLDVPSASASNAARRERGLAALAPVITAAHQGHTARAVPFVLTSRVVRYSGDDAQVAVWGGAIFAVDQVISPEMVVAETTYSLRWLGDWRVLDDGGPEGPGVKALTTPAQSNELPPELGREATGIGDVAGP